LVKSEQMGFYSRYVVPGLTHLSMGQAQLQPYRARVINGAIGRVLEIGFGSGRNIPYYGTAVDEVVGVDVSPEMLALAAPAIAGSPCRVTLLARSAESLPFADRTFDTVVTTWSLCSISDPAAALREARRVLKGQGQLRFVEHGLSPDPGVSKWQNRLTPVWCRCAGGCHLNRKIDDLVRSAGFTYAELSTGYAHGLRPMAYMYEGTVTPK
jgi:ubiquinone/menaquinone biosynthesis C-methylase UbiE